MAKIQGCLDVMAPNGTIASLLFETEGPWLSSGDGRDPSRIRGGEPITVDLKYDDGSIYTWHAAFKPRGLLARLWIEAKLWWEGR